MIRAWEIAKAAATKLGGKSFQYIGEAMKRAWMEFKKGIKNMQTKLQDKIDGTIAEIIEIATQKGIDESHSQIQKYKDYAIKMKAMLKSSDDRNENLNKIFEHSNQLKRLEILAKTIGFKG